MQRLSVFGSSVRRIAAFACLAALVPVARAGQLLAPGDIVVVGFVGGGPFGVVRVDPVTGAQTLLQTGNFGFNFIAVDRDEKLYGSVGTTPAEAQIVCLDLATGASSILTAGQNLWMPQGIAIDEAGDLLVSNQNMSAFPPSDASFLRINAQTGQQTVLAQGVFLARPKDIALDVDGTAVVVDDTLWGALFRANPQTGAVTVISETQQNSLLIVSTLVALAPGAIFVNGPNGTNGLVRVDPATGLQFQSLQGLSSLTSIKSSLDGRLFLAQSPIGQPPSVVRFDPVTETIVGTVTSGGFLFNITDMAVVPAPRGAGKPVKYCTAKVNSLGCLPAISSAGVPSASAANGFVVTATPVYNQKAGMLLYSLTGRDALPFQGGFLCVASPVKRTLVCNSGGSPFPLKDCTGGWRIDMNAFSSGTIGGHPDPMLSRPGTFVHCQWWGRDPGFTPPNATALSDALQYAVQP